MTYILSPTAENRTDRATVCHMFKASGQNCDCRADKDNQIRDAILSQYNSEYMRRKLLKEGTDLTIAVQFEHVELQMEALHISPETEVK